MSRQVVYPPEVSRNFARSFASMSARLARSIRTMFATFHRMAGKASMPGKPSNSHLGAPSFTETRKRRSSSVISVLIVTMHFYRAATSSS